MELLFLIHNLLIAKDTYICFIAELLQYYEVKKNRPTKRRRIYEITSASGHDLLFKKLHSFMHVLMFECLSHLHTVYMYLYMNGYLHLQTASSPMPT